MTTEPVRVLVVEDEPELLRSLVAALRDFPSLVLVGAADNVDSAIELALECRPDVVLADYKMPRGGGPRLVREIRASSPGTKVVAFSAHDDRHAVREMLRAGAVGFLVKGVEIEEIESALVRAAGGELILSGSFVVEMMQGLSEQLQSESLSNGRFDEIARSIRTALSSHQIRAVYQPIIDLETDETVGFEALARFPSAYGKGPSEWFAEAEEAGLRVELEREALRVALAGAADLSPQQFLSVNLSPAGALDPAALELLAAHGPERLVVEVTEHAKVDDYAELLATLAPLRGAGLRLAVDDAGAGYSSLRHLLEMRPDIVKLDTSLSHDIDSDLGRRALAAALIAFARSTGMTLIAEGIETAEERRVLRLLGVVLGQGFWLGHPATTRPTQRHVA